MQKCGLTRATDLMMTWLERNHLTGSDTVGHIVYSAWRRREVLVNILWSYLTCLRLLITAGLAWNIRPFQIYIFLRKASEELWRLKCRDIKAVTTTSYMDIGWFFFCCWSFFWHQSLFLRRSLSLDVTPLYNRGHIQALSVCSQFKQSTSYQKTTPYLSSSLSVPLLAVACHI